MARRLTLVKGASERGALVYGMRMFDANAIASVEEARVTLAGGEGARRQALAGPRPVDGDDVARADARHERGAITPGLDPFRDRLAEPELTVGQRERHHVDDE